MITVKIIVLIVIFIGGLILSIYGIPSSPEDLILQSGEAVIKTINETSNSEDVSYIAGKSLDTFRILGIGFMAISGLLIITEFKK